MNSSAVVYTRVCSILKRAHSESISRAFIEEADRSRDRITDRYIAGVERNGQTIREQMKTIL